MSRDYTTAYQAAINGNHTAEERREALDRIRFRMAQLQAELSELEGIAAGHQAALSRPVSLAVGIRVIVTGPDNGGTTERLLGRPGTLTCRAADDLSAVVEFSDGQMPDMAYFPDSSLEVSA